MSQSSRTITFIAKLSISVSLYIMSYLPNHTFLPMSITSEYTVDPDPYQFAQMSGSARACVFYVKSKELWCVKTFFPSSICRWISPPRVYLNRQCTSNRNILNITFLDVSTQWMHMKWYMVLSFDNNQRRLLLDRYTIITTSSNIVVQICC